MNAGGHMKTRQRWMFQRSRVLVKYGLAGELASTQLLFSDLNKATSDVPSDCAGVTGSHVAHVTVLRDLNAEFLSYLIFHLVQGCGSLRYYELIAGTFLSCCHIYHLR
jgi:hypothetical protein